MRTRAKLTSTSQESLILYVPVQILTFLILTWGERQRETKRDKSERTAEIEYQSSRVQPNEKYRQRVVVLGTVVKKGSSVLWHAAA